MDLEERLHLAAGGEAGVVWDEEQHGGQHEVGAQLPEGALVMDLAGDVRGPGAVGPIVEDAEKAGAFRDDHVLERGVGEGHVAEIRIAALAGGDIVPDVGGVGFV